MLLRNSSAANLLESGINGNDDPFIITPTPNIDSLRKEECASIDLRLGTWFKVTRARKHALLKISDNKDDKPSPTEQSLTKDYYIRFGDRFILHPGSFVLAVTLEWIRLPFILAGMVTGKSSWGRRGLIIETAPGIHPGYSGCLTLELTNVGEVPIELKPGICICQLFLHKLDGAVNMADRSGFVGQRQPALGKIKTDDFALKLFRNGDKN